MTGDSADAVKKIEQLIEDYGNAVLRYAYLYLGDLEWAKDASQQVFLRVYQSIHGYRGEASMKTWILRITMNTCKNIRKSREYRKVMAECSLDALQTHIVHDSNLDLEDKEIWQEVLQLPDTYRNVVVLKYYHDYTNEEIAGLLKLSQSAVRSRLSRAMTRMRKDMEGRMDLYEPEIAK